MILSLLLLTQEEMTLDRLAGLVALSSIALLVMLGTIQIIALVAIDNLRKELKKAGKL